MNRRSHTGSPVCECNLLKLNRARENQPTEILRKKKNLFEKWTVAQSNEKKTKIDFVECLWSISDLDAAMCASARSTVLSIPFPAARSNFSCTATHSLTLRRKQASYQFIILLFNSIFVLISYRLVHARCKISPESASAEKKNI